MEIRQINTNEVESSPNYTKMSYAFLCRAQKKKANDGHEESVAKETRRKKIEMYLISKTLQEKKKGKAKSRNFIIITGYLRRHHY